MLLTDRSTDSEGAFHHVVVKVRVMLRVMLRVMHRVMLRVRVRSRGAFNPLECRFPALTLALADLGPPRIENLTAAVSGLEPTLPHLECIRLKRSLLRYGTVYGSVYFGGRESRAVVGVSAWILGLGFGAPCWRYLYSSA